MEKNSNKPLTEKQYRRWQRMMFIGKHICHCHQMSDRSFHYHGMQFPVCARCTGILIGFFIIGPIITIFHRGNMYLSMGLIVLMAIDGGLQFFNIMKSNNFRRLITGLGYGYAVFSIIVHIIIKTFYLING